MQHDVCGGHCFFWARVDWQPARSLIIGSIIDDDTVNSTYIQIVARNHNATSTSHFVDYLWYEDAYLHFQHGMHHCGWFHLSCLVSCYFAATLLMLFSISGRGGYDTSRFIASWRIVVPALIFSLLMMMMTMAATHVLSQGYLGLSQSMAETAAKVNATVDYSLKSYEACEVFKSFTWKHNSQRLDACAIHAMIGWTSWLMVWSWIIAFISLTLRILVTADFILLKVKIYDLPDDETEKEAILEKVRQGKINIGSPSAFPSFVIPTVSNDVTDFEEKRDERISIMTEENVLETNMDDDNGDVNFDSEERLKKE
ncbi:hypothetical protein QAD02_004752 [Eretmocerus hayati]|uniref:Uncharacterized protein n=1 Tax=Eretmocerus hayati TaxID=131215 RepID=A0ACC2NQL4_9HYME|nr:hypothetical protein QAD02_004752 [Eretmocerus hayati]